MKGSAYVFVTSDNGTTWAEVQKVVASDGASGDRFGESVSIHGIFIGVGASKEDNAKGSDAGAIY